MAGHGADLAVTTKSPSSPLLATTVPSTLLGTMEGSNGESLLGMPLGSEDGRDEPDGAIWVLKS